MLISKVVNIKIPKNKQPHYRKKGYIFKYGDTVIVKCEDLHDNCNEIVEVKCDICGNVKFIKYSKYIHNLYWGGVYSCSIPCGQLKAKQTNLTKYGVDSYSKTKEYREKYRASDALTNMKKTCLEKYGVEFAAQSDIVKQHLKEACQIKFNADSPFGSDIIREKIKKTIMDRYGVTHNTKSPIVIQNRKENTMKKYGVEHTTQLQTTKTTISNNIFKKYNVRNVQNLNWVRESVIQTCINKYGVENPMQNANIFIKNQISAYKLKYYKNSIITYRGTYELDFLELCERKQIKVENGKTIYYVYDGSQKIYYSDFYLPDYNLIVEIKSNYTYNKYLDKNLAKQKACIEQGYNFIFIINKQYDEFNKKIREL